MRCSRRRRLRTCKLPCESGKRHQALVHLWLEILQLEGVHPFLEVMLQRPFLQPTAPAPDARDILERQEMMGCTPRAQARGGEPNVRKL